MTEKPWLSNAKRSRHKLSNQIISNNQKESDYYHGGEGLNEYLLGENRHHEDLNSWLSILELWYLPL